MDQECVENGLSTQPCGIPIFIVIVLCKIPYFSRLGSANYKVQNLVANDGWHTKDGKLVDEHRWCHRVEC